MLAWHWKYIKEVFWLEGINTHHWVQYVRMGMVGMTYTQDVIQSLLQLSLAGHGDSEEILITVLSWGTRTWGKWNEIGKPIRYILQGEPQSILHGRMYDVRAEDCCRTALALVLAVKKY